MIGSVDERFDQVASPREVGPRVLPIHLIEHLYVQHLYVQQVMNTVHKSRKFYQPIGCRIVWLNVLYEYENKSESEADLRKDHHRSVRAGRMRRHLLCNNKVLIDMRIFISTFH